MYAPEMFPDCPDDLNRNFLLGERAKYESVIPPLGRIITITATRGIARWFWIPPPVRFISSRRCWRPGNGWRPTPRSALGALAAASCCLCSTRRFPRTFRLPTWNRAPSGRPSGIPMQLFGGMGERERTIVPRARRRQRHVRHAVQRRLVLQGSDPAGLGGERRGRVCRTTQSAPGHGAELPLPGGRGLQPQADPDKNSMRVTRDGCSARPPPPRWRRHSRFWRPTKNTWAGRKRELRLLRTDCRSLDGAPTSINSPTPSMAPKTGTSSSIAAATLIRYYAAGGG